jgi:hypothetical protein
VGTQIGTQKCAERAVEAVDAVHAVRNYLRNLVLVDFKRVVDTVGVWGSNPHAPTNTLNNLATSTALFVDPKRSTQKPKSSLSYH